MKSSLQRTTILRVALDVPLAISQRTEVALSKDALFDYRWSDLATPGQRVIVPWGRQVTIGLVVENATSSALEPSRLRDAVAVLDDVAALSPLWFDLVRFAAKYYQRSFGEVALPALPSLLRKSAGYQDRGGSMRSRSMGMLEKKLERFVELQGADAANERSCETPGSVAPSLTFEQSAAVDAIRARLGESSPGFAPFLLHGITGSGKTEVYLQAIASTLASNRQVLVLVPEINLTPQLERLFRARFNDAVIATLHSGMADGARALHWLASHAGHTDVLLGTRMAVLASLPRLGLIIVDEEHDPSFKQQEGLRYSARDLAVVRARQAQIPIVMGSATPSFESWSQVQRRRYTKLALTARANQASALPKVQLLDVRRSALVHGFSEILRSAIADRLQRGQQSLVFLNRRGYAPVLCCSACGWISDCRRCSAHMVFHKSDRLLHCHHCGLQLAVPRACPSCGNLDLAPLGRGTQRVEEALHEWFPKARIARIDRDSTRRRGSAQAMLDEVHAGDVDILVGTQMVAKGHDFQNLTLVGVVEADSALYSHDFRAPERLFANLMQVAGRAGRSEKPGEVMIQTRFTAHPLFAALVEHDYQRFAEAQLAERQVAMLPPYTYQAMLRAEARTLSLALAFLEGARSLAATLTDKEVVTLFDPVPMPLVRLANVERAQLLVEALGRPALQAFLPAWIALLQAQKTPVHWHVEVDPVDI